jgi:hypothetical protein
MKKALCLITFNPNSIYLDFLQNFNYYDIFVIIDDLYFNSHHLQQTYKSITFIQISNQLCCNYGFKNTSFITLKKQISGWDKALFYFSYINQQYDHIWFMEDDVYIYNESTLINIDKKYTYESLLCNSSFKEENLNEWLWNQIHIYIDPPYYCGMMCIVRMSKYMISSIKDYASTHHTLFFLEALFPTLAVKYKLMYSNPIEFKTVTHRDLHTYLNKTYLYHPVKDLNIHLESRQCNMFTYIINYIRTYI